MIQGEFPAYRARRMRATETLRQFVREAAGGIVGGAGTIITNHAKEAARWLAE